VRPQHVALAILVAALWGFNFVVIRVGVTSVSPLLLVALRFLVAAAPALVIPCPAIPPWRLALLGCIWFACQFVLLFAGIKAGMPPGLASICMQMQAFMTIVFARVFLSEKPSGRQIAGILVGTAGLVTISMTVSDSDADVTLAGFALVLGGAASWAAGNVIMRGLPRANMLGVVAWTSLVPPAPLILLACLIDGPMLVGQAVMNLTPLSIACILYLAVVATHICFGIWGYLLTMYPAGLVAPFSLLVPLFGGGASALVFGERFGALRLFGIALIISGLVIIVFPSRKSFARSQPGSIS
jgi:O-acetylserine/cysteine efflux transporter